MKTMKKFAYAMMTAAFAFAFSSCQKDANVAPADGQDATVSVRIAKGETRAIGTGTATELETAESAIKTLEVFVFNEDARDGYGKAEGTNVDKVEGINVSAGQRSIIVVANAKEDLSGVTSKAALKAKIATDLEQETTANGLLMTSEETAKFTVVAGHNQYGYTTAAPSANQIEANKPVVLTRVAARVALVSAKVAFVDAFAGYKFTPEAVYVYNVKKQSKYFGADLNQGDVTLMGDDLTAFSGDLKATTTITVAPYLKDTVTDLSTITTDKPVYYYVFENSATAPSKSTVLTIKGKITDAQGASVDKTKFPDAFDDNGYTYYSIVVNANKAGYTFSGETVDHDGKILRNTKYDLSVTIKRLGKNDPTVVPSEPATLDVMVKVAPWKTVNQTVEY